MIWSGYESDRTMLEFPWWENGEAPRVLPLCVGYPILGDPGAASWGDGNFTRESSQQELQSPALPFLL